ncbi:18.1 kDa class I heat shock protein-like isoform X1 [Iris pallida]|uniref:18.1 kDa class I heat shock protein-like isoform X1 n=1 Tax=Iris pallida TaxID=29817 RepID=A0AAX6DGS4_IRIPA|nr:18.1 kDa class I heat shock protein-like isoform X1 [Iris pallida]
MSMDLTSGFLTTSLGTVTVSTPFSIAAFTWSTFAFSGRRNLLRNFPLLLSTRCHLSFFSSCSLLLSPLIWRTLPSSTSTFTSSFLIPGRSALNTWASGVSFQSKLVLAKAEVSPAMLDRGKEEERALVTKLSKGSHRSEDDRGSKIREPNPNGTSDIPPSKEEIKSYRSGIILIDGFVNHCVATEL